MMLLIRSGPVGSVPTPPPATAPTLGAHTLVSQANDGTGTNPMNSAAITTQAHTTILVFRSGVTTDDSAPTDNYSNTYVKIGNSTPYSGQTQYQITVYLCLVANGGAGHILHFAKPTNPTSESTAAIVEILGTSNYQIKNNYPTVSPGTTSSITTTGPALLIGYWAGDGDQTGTTMSCTSSAPFTDLDKMLVIPAAGAVQTLDAYSTQTSAGTYSATFTWSPVQGAGCYLLSFQQ